VIDALLPDIVRPHEDGLRVVFPGYSLAVTCPSRDAEWLLGQSGEPILTLVEIDGDRLATPVLLGFASEGRRRLYRVLRDLPGIGRRSALNVLDCGETTDILRAVSGEDGEFFRQVPGLGNKRIEALIARLRKSYQGSLPEALPVAVREWVEAREALIGSGMSYIEAEEELRESSGETAEELLEGLG
jgi:Holliday junction resolvasome RuvABC DNA-binding subunit